MIGGDGSDSYHVREMGDVVTETNATASTGGTDMVYSYLAAYTLGANVENGGVFAAGPANLTGNGLNNVLYAGADNNLLNGGVGSDTAAYDYAGSAVSVSLAVGTAQATGGSGSDTLTAIENLTGSSYNDTLSGNAGANILDGGAGIDTMTGGDGSDIYYVRNVGDMVTETNATAGTGGTDTVYSYLATHTLAANVENGRIMSGGAANLTGNGLNNVLFAGAGNNVMNGDVGTDTASYQLAGSAVGISLAVSTAQATGGSGSDTLTAIENLTGSNYGDVLTGSTSANVLAGGTGNDVLTGGAGLDAFLFNTALNAATNLDMLTDFSAADDTIRLENAIFTQLATTGTLNAAHFRASTAGTAADGDDYILYDSDSGALYYDADGNGAGLAVQFASLTGNPVISNSDFMVI
jgi:Ca2+-binding RTX toxin-like protein